MPSRPPRRRAAALAALALLAAACERTPAAPEEISYLAVLARVDAPGGVSLAGPWRYRVAELSGTLGIDTTLAVSPRDTVILEVPRASYAVVLDGVPTWCEVRGGPAQVVNVVAASTPEAPAQVLTALARFHVTCVPSLTIRALADGPDADLEYVWRVDDARGTVRTGILAANDTLAVDGLAPGAYTVHLSHVAERCVVTSDGGARRAVTVVAARPAEAVFRVVCSDPAERPRIVSLVSGWNAGASGFAARVHDPQRNLDRYWWDLTDCEGRSVLPGGPVWRRGLLGGRLAQEDTALVIGGFETELTAEQVRGRCNAVRFEDASGNTTPWVEEPIGNERGSPPSASVFNGALVGTTAFRLTLAVADPDGDALGFLPWVRLRDGVLNDPDGRFDTGLWTVPGYRAGTAPPDIALTGRIRYDDVLATVVYLVDAGGNVVRLEDAETFR